VNGLASETRSRSQRLVHGLVVVGGAAFWCLLCLLVLPVLRAISEGPVHDVDIREVTTTELPPPAPPIEAEKPPEEPPETPEVGGDDPEPLDLSQLELALDTGAGGSGGLGDFALRLPSLGGKDDQLDELFSLADLDQRPRPVFQQQPVVTAAMRRRMPATVHLLFDIDENGRVDQPVVESSTDATFDQAALDAVRRWRFEPGKRGGKPVRFRMRQPMTFK
jgi:periplasmic protein TonB